MPNIENRMPIQELADFKHRYSVASKENIQKAQEAVEQFRDQYLDIDILLMFCTNNGYSDLFLKDDNYPYVSKAGITVKVPCKKISANDILRWRMDKTKNFNDRNNDLARNKQLDLSYEVTDMDILSQYADIPDYFKKRNNIPLDQKVCRGYYRYRVTIGFTEEKISVVFRMLNPIKTVQELHINPSVYKIFTDALMTPDGISIVSGPTGSGKSTTINSMLYTLTSTGMLSGKTLISLEDPIEYIIPASNTFNVIRKEKGLDFDEWDMGIKQALRMHPNFIDVGETRDYTTIMALLEAARTGHNTITTFHTGSVSATVSRLSEYFTAENKNQFYDLIMNLNLVVCQRMVPSDHIIIDTEFCRFTNGLKQLLVDDINHDRNIQFTIDDFISNKKLQNAGIVKSFKY